ncbi:MAG: hypothetical protein CFH40_02255 [Alphaproteobacteria bacterium MarineAlpha10_Bin3]|nr:MAG: hypothetical protein CFH40_02255 [Alphaproteobacteria bacterium MarineAlpha10_Bin3]PPR67620.1 MAG: hypothetical protein CFH09_02255 [Alphaproteobacteria bacterium MarineAlpha4_Bin1]
MTALEIEHIESEILKTAADGYRDRGYQVKILPDRDDLPRFLKMFAPDLLAVSADDRVVVEVMLSGSAPKGKSLTALAVAVQNERDWRLEVIYSDELAEERTRKPGRNVRRQDISNKLREVDSLLRENRNDTALLLLAASIEGTLRLVGKFEDIRIDDRDSPIAVLKISLAHGILSEKQFETFKEILIFRNMVAHGIRMEVKNSVFLKRAVVLCLDVLSDLSRQQKQGAVRHG